MGIVTGSFVIRYKKAKLSVMRNKKKQNLSEVQKMRERDILDKIFHLLRQSELISIEEEVEAQKILNGMKE